MDEVHGQNGIQDKRRRKRAIKRTCSICGIEFYGIKDITGRFGSKKRRIQKYCSKKCWNVRATIINKCQFCGNKIRTYKSVNKKYCGFECRDKAYIGRKLSKSHRENISKALKGKLPKNHWRTGEKHPFWNPNRTNQRERGTKKYKRWRLAIYKRDNYTCQICGIRGKKGIRPIFHADHIKPFGKFPTLRFKLSNGRTLCRPCHLQTETWGSRMFSC